MKRLVKRMVSLIALFSLVLCSGCWDKDEKVKVKIREDGSNLCDEYAEVICHNIFECCVGTELEARLGVEITTDSASCRDDISLTCELDMAPFLYAMSLGRIVLDTESAKACLEEYLVGDDGCFPYVTAVWPACETDMFSGVQKAGQACLSDNDCVDTAYCGADRKCREKGAKNDPCVREGASDAPAMPCKPAYYCGYNPEVSEDTICLPLVEPGDPCDADSECEPNLVCVPDDESGQDVCTAKKKLDQTCNRNTVCTSGLCLPGVCDNGAFCDENAPCADGSECTDRVCAKNLRQINYCEQGIPFFGTTGN